MKVIIGRYFVDVNDNTIIDTQKEIWVRERVAVFTWTDIDDNILEEKFSEIYDLVKGTIENE